jgi:hypothetical protein
MIDISELPGTFFDAAALADFWQYVKWVTYFLMPLLVIVGAVLLVDRFMDMLLGVFGFSSKQDQDDADDDDYDVKYY